MRREDKRGRKQRRGDQGKTKGKVVKKVERIEKERRETTKVKGMVRVEEI